MMPTTYPNEAWTADGGVEQLDGTNDAATGLPFVPKGTGPTSAPTYEVQYNRRLERQNRILAPWRQLQVVDEGGLKIGVYPGAYTLGGVRKTFDGATNQAVADSSTKYAYLDSSNTLQIADTEPTDLTTFLPLAEVQTAGGVMTLTDRRLLSAFHIPQIEDSADITGTPNETFQIDDDNTGPKLKNSSGTLQVRDDGDSDDADLQCGTLNAIDEVQINGSTAINGSGEATGVASGAVGTGGLANNAVTGAKLAGALQLRVAGCSFQIGSEASDAIDVTIQFEDSEGTSISEKRLVRAWIGDAVEGVEAATAPSGGVAVQTGGLLQTVTTGKHLLVITDATGAAVIRLSESGTPTFYLMVEFDGKVFSSSGITFA